MGDDIEINNLAREIEQSFGKVDESGQVQAIKALFDKDNIKMKSDLKENLGEANYFARLYTLGSIIDSKILVDYCDEEIGLRVSNNRQGRQEAVMVSRSHPEQEKKSTMFGRMFGR